MNKIVIVDGNSLLFRSFYGTYRPDKPILKTSYNLPTNAIVAFTNMIVNIMNTLNDGDGFFVAFDKGKETFRHKEFKEYKANRKKTPEELLLQMPIAREFLDSLNIVFYETDELEADDIAGIMAKKAENQNFKVEIYTSDHDYLQLINENITIKLIKKSINDAINFDLNYFKKEYEDIDPILVRDYKGLVGDSSDNLPGIPKVGPKTALKLLKEYGSLENIIDNIDKNSSKVAESIVNNKDIGLLCKLLATIRVNEPINLEINDIIYKGYNLEKIKEFSNKYELKRLISHLPNLSLNINEEISIRYEEIESIKNLKIKDEITFILDYNNDNKLNYHELDFYGISLLCEDKCYYINKDNLIKDLDLIDILQDNNIKKICYDFKKNSYLLLRYNINLNNLGFDLKLASYILDPVTNLDFIDILKNNYINLNQQYLEEYNSNLNNKIYVSCVNTYYLNVLKNKILLELKQKNQYDLLINIEQPLSHILFEIEKEGFPVDKDILLEFKKEFENKLENIQSEIFNISKEEFNISSPKQLSYILFDKLKLTPNKKNSTSQEFLVKLRDENPIIDLIIDYRKYSKLISTFIDGIISHIDEKDNKIHTILNQTSTSTGRLSSEEPNLQTISIKDEESKQLRKVYYYKENNIYLLSFDYSQIELRILAHLSNSKSLIEIFEKDNDIHEETAKKIFNLDRVANEFERRKAKAINYGIIYGISVWGLAEQINCSIDYAKDVIQNFYKSFPEIKSYLDNIVSFCETHSYVETIFKRRRYIDKINDSNQIVRQFAKRAAINAPIQGSAADLIKIAMIKVDNFLKENKLKSKLILQIHDELILKVYADEKDIVYKNVKDIMENVVNLKVPLKVDGGYAKNWFDAK
ncbi:MAG: DNA polymerase I [Bacillales bacterium]